MDDIYDTITKTWLDKRGCPKAKDGRHWATYVCQNEEEWEYWTKERIDEANNCWWRRYDFMSIPCSECGAYSPLRASTYFLSNLHGDYTKESCKKKKVVNYRPSDELPESIRRYKENGWTYYFFIKTLSDSLCGQETFVLKRLPT